MGTGFAVRKGVRQRLSLFSESGNRFRGQTLAYSSENRLETLSGAGVEAEFSYDAEGRRKRMLVGNTSTAFVHAGTMEIAEYDGDSGALLRRYIPGPGVDQRVLMITCGSSTNCAPNQSGADTYAYTADRLGHVVAVTHTQTGAIERYVYSPYGVELRGDESGNPFRYTGRRYDAETGLYYYRARYYDADLGRFLSTDPIGYADQWNLYAYVANDPLNATDPTGRESYIVSRRIFTPVEARAAATAAYAAARGTHTMRARAGAAAYNATINTKHAFLVVTEAGTSISEGRIEGVYSYGPENANRSAGRPSGNTVRQNFGTKTLFDDVEALESIINGEAVPGVSYEEIVGLGNDDAHFLFGVESDPRPYSPVPAAVPGSTNSNAEAFARGQAGAALAGTRFVAPSGIHPGAGQAERVTCTGSRIARDSC
ncbi:RHS repeat-associated core domain-containing protein [Oceanicaulis sp.]|uniref:RHS repeat-associated core domain-containing protein n=1 Tax=Oceanicaulis sp. TaxID=1924941 RepID=UPI003D2CCBBB